MGAVLGLVFLAVIGFFVWVSHTLSEELKKIPQEYRVVEPHFAWFMLIPLASLYFYWLLLPGKIPESIKRYYSGSGSSVDSQEDFGNKKGLYAALACTAMYVPGLDVIAWIPAAFFLHSYVKNAQRLIAMILNGAGGTVDPESKPLLVGKESSSHAKAAPGEDVVSRLERLKKLLDDGAITNEEYQLQKSRLLT